MLLTLVTAELNAAISAHQPAAPYIQLDDSDRQLNYSWCCGDRVLRVTYGMSFEYPIAEGQAAGQIARVWVPFDEDHVEEAFTWLKVGLI